MYGGNAIISMPVDMLDLFYAFFVHCPAIAGGGDCPIIWHACNFSASVTLL